MEEVLKGARGMGSWAKSCARCEMKAKRKRHIMKTEAANTRTRTIPDLKPWIDVDGLQFIDAFWVPIIDYRSLLEASNISIRRGESIFS